MGTNIRSLYAAENFYALNKLLEDKKPDIVFINESWHQEEEKSKYFPARTTAFCFLRLTVQGEEVWRSYTEARC